jgi:hypothetical protein
MDLQSVFVDSGKRKNIKQVVEVCIIIKADVGHAVRLDEGLRNASGVILSIGSLNGTSSAMRRPSSSRLFARR